MYGTTTASKALISNTGYRHVSPAVNVNSGANIQVWTVPFSVLRNHTDQSQHLSTDERDQAARMLSPTATRDYCLSRSFLRSVLAAQMSCSPIDVDIRYSTYGKPFVLNGPAFNLSHCKRALAVAVANSGFAGQLGLDVETRITDPNCLHLAEKCFTLLERRQLSTFQTCVAQQNAFTRGWTRKEAVVKAFGTGLRSSLGSFDVSLQKGRKPSKDGRYTDQQSLLLASELEGISIENCKLYDLGSILNCELSLAVVNDISAGVNTVQIRHVDEKQLLKLTEFYHV